MDRDDITIIVIGARRPAMLRSTLESLRRQEALPNVQIWLDGHQGFADLLGPVEQCRTEAAKFPEARVIAYSGHVGIEKLMLDALRMAVGESERLIILEDDCFPTSSAVRVFHEGLDLIDGRSDIYSVYGHHFLVPDERDTISRFQGWGWATTRRKLLPVLEKLERCYALPEPKYLAWVERSLTPEVRGRVEVTPGRNPIDTARRFFSWDSCTAIVTAAMGLLHKKTPRRVVFNCGVGADGGHFDTSYFLDTERFRMPPFNMIRPEEAWSVFDE